MRHLASQYNVDLHDLVKFEKRGFGRTETITLVLLSQATNKPLKEYAKERLKNKTPLRELSKQAGVDYQALYNVVQDIKNDIESMGDKNLPPPVFDKKPKDPEDIKKEKKLKKKQKAQAKKELKSNDK